MRKIKESLRLYWLGLKQRQIARACSIGQSTVSEYVKLAEAAGVKWPDVADLDDDQLMAKLAPVPSSEPERGRLPAPDFATVHHELKTNKHVTMQLLWEEYREQNPDGYRYSRYCELYQRWRRKQDVVMRQDHRPGEKLFVDYAGATIPVKDSNTGEIRQAQLFLAVLGASNYTYVELTWSQDQSDWIASHVRAFDYFGAVPEIVVPDNLKSGVTKPCRYEPGINIAYEEMARHYGVAVIPARVRKPRDKAKVETGVLIVERWIVAALRKRTFFSLGEASEAVSALLERLNEKSFRKLDGCRRSVFETVEKPALKPLPAERYQTSEWKKTRVNIDHHVEFDRHWYSVPYELTQQQVEVHATAATVEILHKGRRVASHARSRLEWKHSTVEEHRPKAHRKNAEWPPSRIVDWAGSVGPSTAKAVETILNSKRHPEQGYRSCLGLIRLAKRYPVERVEAASARALALNACSYKSIESMLKNNLDRQDPPVPDTGQQVPALMHDNIRGAGYYVPGSATGAGETGSVSC